MNKTITLFTALFMANLAQAEYSPLIVGEVDHILTTERETFVSIDFVSHYELTTVTFWVWDITERRWMTNQIHVHQQKFNMPLYSFYTPNPSYIYWSVMNEAGTVLRSGQFENF